jgi:hypothetical protein
MPDHPPIPIDARSVAASSPRSHVEVARPPDPLVFDGGHDRRVTGLREEKDA